MSIIDSERDRTQPDSWRSIIPELGRSSVSEHSKRAFRAVPLLMAPNRVNAAVGEDLDREELPTGVAHCYPLRVLWHQRVPQPSAFIPSPP
jgi:hypothetical protein